MTCKIFSEPRKGRNTIHERRNWPKFVTIHYFLHPRYQQEVEIIEKRDFVHEKYYLTVFFDRTVLLPDWMTDLDYCRALELQETARCSLTALQELRLLIDEIQF